MKKEAEPDGNGRMARFFMNAMLASGGYPWTVVRVEDRTTYLGLRAVLGHWLFSYIHPYPDDSNLFARASRIADPYYVGYGSAAAHYGLTTVPKRLASAISVPSLVTLNQ